MSTSTITRTKKPKELIKAATVATALDKSTGKVLGWSVKSSSSEQYYCIQTMTTEEGTRLFFCDCEAHLWGYAECCHIKAVKEVLAAKAELEKEAQEKHDAAIEEAHRASLIHQDNARLRRLQGKQAFEKLKRLVRDIERFGRFDEQVNETPPFHLVS